MAIDRRTFIKACAGVTAATPLTGFRALAAPLKNRVRIRDIQVMVLQGPRTYTLVKVVADTGVCGIGEGYGSPGVGVKEGRIGNGDWMDDVILHDGPVVKDGYIALPEKPGLGIELNPDVVKAHLAKDEHYWD